MFRTSGGQVLQETGKGRNTGPATDGNHLELVGVAFHQVQGLGSDGTGRPQHDQAQRRGKIQQGTAAGIKAEKAMKMEIDVSAPIDGTVTEVAVAVGDLVDPDAELLRLDPSPDGS